MRWGSPPVKRTAASMDATEGLRITSGDSSEEEEEEEEELSWKRCGFRVSKQMIPLKHCSSIPNLSNTLFACFMSELVNIYNFKKNFKKKIKKKWYFNFNILIFMLFSWLKNGEKGDLTIFGCWMLFKSSLSWGSGLIHSYGRVQWT